MEATIVEMSPLVQETPELEEVRSEDECCDFGPAGDLSLISRSNLNKSNNGEDLDYIKQDWYGWERIHYEAFHSNPDTLKVECDKLVPSRINTLTMLSENALHILLEHSSCSQSFLVSCHNGPHRKMTKILNKEDCRIIACAEILINAKIDVNHANFWNETPILIAIKRKYFQVVKLLLQRKGIDLDTCKDAVSGRSARDFLKNRNDLGILPSGTTSKKNLFQLLKSGDEENFLKCGNDRSLNVNSLDGDNEENSSCTLLQYCFRKSLILWYHEKTTYECDLNFFYQDITANRMVQVFCQSGMARCIQHLLDNGANVDFRLGKFEGRLSVLEAAIIKGFYPLVALILGRNEEMDNKRLKDICRAVHKLINLNNNTTEHNSMNFNKTLSIVLNRLIECPREVKNELKLFLKEGVGNINKENLLLLLKFPSIMICQETKNVLENIDSKILETHFDDCVVREGKNVSIDCVSFLDDQQSVHTIFKNFLDSPVLSECFNHVIFKILIMREWDNLGFKVHCFQMKYFYVDFFFHVIFYVLLNLYIFCKFDNVFSMFLYVSGWICLAIFIAKEVFRIFTDLKSYFQDYHRNCYGLIFVVVTIVVYNADIKSNFISFDIISLVSLNLVLFILLLHVPACTKYIINFLQKIVPKDIILYFFLFSIFANICYIMFTITAIYRDQAVSSSPPKDLFTSCLLSLFNNIFDKMKTIWIQNNEISSENLNQKNFQYGDFYAIICLAFIVVFSIVINKKNFHEQIMRVSFIIRMETFFNSWCLPKWFKSNILRYHKKKISKKIKIDDNDRKILTKEEKLNLDFILKKKAERLNSLEKLRNHIMAKMKEGNYEQKNEQDKGIVEKLEVMEEIMKNWHKMNQLNRND